MLPFLKKSNQMLGLDIGASCVKLLELSHSNNLYKLESYSIIPIPDDAVVEKEIKKPEVVSEALKAALAHCRTRVKNVAIAMPNTLVITKIIQMDGALGPKDLEVQIQLDANRYIPYPLEEVSFDFVDLGPSRKDETKKDILLAASRTEQMDSRVDLIQDVGLTVKVVDVESYALERACKLIANQLPAGAAEKVIAIFNVGATSTSITILQNMNIIYMRDEAFGGKQLTEDIKNRFELTNEQAEFAKRSGSGLPADYNMDVLIPFKDSMATQISHALQFFYSSSGMGDVDCIVLTGGSAGVAELASTVQQNTGVNTVVANPKDSMEINRRINEDELRLDAPSLMIACGLAMRSYEE